MQLVMNGAVHRVQISDRKKRQDLELLKLDI